MIALLLLSLCLGNIVGHRLDNCLFKPVPDFIGSEVTPVISKAPTDDDQNPMEDSIFTELCDSERGCTKSKENVDFDSLSSKGFDCKRSEPTKDDSPIEIFSQNQMQSLSDRQSSELAYSKDKSPISGNRFLHVLPVSQFADFFKDLLVDANKKHSKRAGTAPVIGCDCKVKIDLLDLGQQHYPRYLMNAVCQNNQSPNEYPEKCWRGSYCRPLEYKVKVLTPRTPLDLAQNDPALAWLPDVLRQEWKFKTINVVAGCFCSY